jgi:putative tryptophan/tyrosine transport system substrate-binding protein
MAQGIDPVGNSYVESLARPGGNTTGFIQFEYSLAGKWMELLKEVAPGVTRVGVLREPAAAAIGQWAMIQAVAQSLGAELKPIDSRNADELERSITAFARAPNGGLIVAVSAAARTHRDLIITLAARYRLPTVYAYRAKPAAPWCRGTNQDHGCVPMAVAAGLPGGRHQALDLGTRQILATAN